ncbi:serine hydrolase domain-containing protein [Muriicola sp. Z0-33]|uniref:serine hydrolase domain-containing protein n=1 Tax=Muriicola sp. Z0-33 TaxID=2816957 RepID=UPI002237A673|nr:serine hydrolase domain-containing protein [Muriicola sp. Z0-33]MCW5515901.1 beta-lactamase family protein [Muriicola sp. Z0-33]
MAILIILKSHGQNSESIDSLVREYASRGFNGNILYSKNDSIIYTGNYGYSNFSSQKPLDNSTVFELASCSKQFTALGIVQLVEKNLIGYDTYVDKILSNFPYYNITIANLLRHQSGLPDYQKILYDRKHWNRKNVATNSDVISLLGKLKLDLRFQPGTKYEYNNTGYAVLASIIENVSGQSYKSYITENIFKPSGMSSSRVFDDFDQTELFQNVARGYTYNQQTGKYQEIENDKNHKHIHWMNGVVGDRGIYSSILDLEKWKKAIKYNLLIKDGSKEIMMSVDEISTKYGYGWAIYNSSGKGRWVYHNGSWSGYKTMMLYLPDSNEFLVILSNNRFEATYKKFEEDFYKLIQ